MSQTFQLPISKNNQEPVNFPDCCVCCGAPREAESALVINQLVMRGNRQEQINLKYQVPHCDKCARSTKANFLAGLIPFVLGFLLVGGAAFILAVSYADLLGLDNYGQPRNYNSIVLGAAAGLFAGFIGGFLFEGITRVILLPVYGRALLQTPLLLTQFLKNADYVAGLSAKPDQAASYLILTFANDEIAETFKALNTTAHRLER